jgi:hypothetical protein
VRVDSYVNVYSHRTNSAPLKSRAHDAARLFQTVNLDNHLSSVLQKMRLGIINNWRIYFTLPDPPMLVWRPPAAVTLMMGPRPQGGTHSSVCVSGSARSLYPCPAAACARVAGCRGTHYSLSGHLISFILQTHHLSGNNKYTTTIYSIHTLANSLYSIHLSFVH